MSVKKLCRRKLAPSKLREFSGEIRRGGKEEIVFFFFKSWREICPLGCCFTDVEIKFQFMCLFVCCCAIVLLRHKELTGFVKLVLLFEFSKVKRGEEFRFSEFLKFSISIFESLIEISKLYKFSRKKLF